ncbi:MAG: 30S ribosomal protein S8 [Gammaproteobacteria bacterium]|jgi:small subunit ribosomal protein S8|nr:30S ribosomal protein S8 [Gammaproteobacteria bacterium]MBT4076247.1 30S ribosomal protein S8 [Gammaproteobacteria bacterium]MBT4859808.1 30S ribosomal protein S8 [Gammaproteobacteria bacterium]MBT6551054.1 30S ribosomal protein S8 [Gammaproteobacteria bacterium]MBT6701356.1 30S ribosomal protein S8 [Gammaproteobacteria bacterium]
MSLQDPVSDMLTRIRNAQKATKVTVKMPSSTQKVNIANVLKGEGYIADFSVSGDAKKELSIELKYFQGKPVIDEIKRVSRPGLRIFKSKDELPSVNGGLGIAIISTSKGMMTEKQARSSGNGGEVICTVV